MRSSSVATTTSVSPLGSRGENSVLFTLDSLHERTKERTKERPAVADARDALMQIGQLNPLQPCLPLVALPVPTSTRPRTRGPVMVVIAGLFVSALTAVGVFVARHNDTTISPRSQPTKQEQSPATQSLASVAPPTVVVPAVVVPAVVVPVVPHATTPAVPVLQSVAIVPSATLPAVSTQRTTTSPTTRIVAHTSHHAVRTTHTTTTSDTHEAHPVATTTAPSCATRCAGNIQCLMDCATAHHAPHG